MRGNNAWFIDRIIVNVDSITPCHQGIPNITGRPTNIAINIHRKMRCFGDSEMKIEGDYRRDTSKPDQQLPSIIHLVQIR